jgi:signal transduction histidine kinase
MQACLPEWREFRVRTRYGGEIESSWTNVRLSDNSQLGIGMDITARNQAERALRASEEALRDSHRLKDEFLATLAHELRNPLAPISNALELIRMGPALEGTAKNALPVLERQLGVMVRLVDDLVDLSRISSGKIELRKERLDIAAVVQTAADNARSFLRSRNHQLTVITSSEAPLLVEGDPIRLHQVFSNLLNNAGKFTPPGGKVWVEVGREKNDAVVRVRDSGVGVSAPMLSQIFEMFVQGAAPGLEGKERGLGIGLSLVRRLLDLHGGTVSASSPGPDRGSEFVVRLPLNG